MNRFDWKWYLSDLKQDRPVKVFSTFSCGGGSSMGYKRAGFQVIGNVEIDPKINKMYVANNHPQHNFCMDLRDFNKLETIPEELIGIDILDGSPPCTTFSTAGLREESWGKKKKFREGQAEQTLDDLFFVFLDTVEKLKPKIVVAENVTGLVKGNAKGYVNKIVNRFKELGYDLQIFSLNSAFMDVPQARHRVFFIANNQNYPKLELKFNYDPITFGQVREKTGVDFANEDGLTAKLAREALPNEKRLADVANRMAGDMSRYFSHIIIHDDNVAKTITSGGTFIRYYDRKMVSNGDLINVSSFPQDYNFCDNNVQYVCGMSVPPNMMANIAEEIYTQWITN